MNEHAEEQFESYYRLPASQKSDVQDSSRPDCAANISNALMHMQIEGKPQDDDEVSTFCTDSSTLSALSGSSSDTTDEEMEIDEYLQDEPMDNGKADIRLVLVLSLKPNMHLYSNEALKAFSWRQDKSSGIQDSIENNTE